MRIFTPIAISGAILLGAAHEIPAGLSYAAWQEATCAIMGRVTIENEAAPDIAVVLQPASSSYPLPPPVARATTDKEGRFKMNGVAAGRYYLIPLAAAYFAPSEDQEVESGKPITLMKGENLDGIELKLILGGVITGRVTTAGGYPVIGKDVYPTLIEARSPHLLPKAKVAGSKFKTDDRGVYRAYGLPAGRYIVGIHNYARNQQRETFYPNANERASASPIEVMAGKVVENIDIKLPPITNAYEVSGRVVDEATGQPIPKISVRCQGDAKSGVNPRGAPSVNERGEFIFTDLTPGRYAVSVPMYSLSEYYSDEVDFEVVDQDVSGLEIKARRASSLSGVVVIEGARDPGALSNLSHLVVSVSKWSGGGFSVPVQASADGRFRIPGLPPDKYGFSIASKMERQRFWLLGVERDGVLQPEGIEVAAGEQAKGLRVIVAYGTGVVRGQVQVVGGSLPEDLRFDVYISRADVTGKPRSAEHVVADARGRFLLEGLTDGEHEISLSPFIPLPNGAKRGTRWPQVKQTVSVTSGAETPVTFVFNVNPSNVKERKQ
ncbi:MAG TPA: carboxypeptidase-like regulatory domain-containing protein [Blastocatellia bacterium]|nr:carboxypeptidase-like regulatory domain-containing protein [Blastocatellia bacterium]